MAQTALSRGTQRIMAVNHPPECGISSLNNDAYFQAQKAHIILFNMPNLQ